MGLFHETDDEGLIDDLRADLSEREDEILGLEHDLEQIAEVHRALGLTIWGQHVTVEVNEVQVTEDHAAVLERLALL